MVAPSIVGSGTKEPNVIWGLPGYDSIPYSEVRGSPQEQYSNGTGHVRRTFLVAWQNRWDFCALMLGRSNVALGYGGGTSYYLSRFPPHAYYDTMTPASNIPATNPKAPLPWLYATQVESIQGEGKSCKTDATEIMGYEYAKITILYESLPYNVYDDFAMSARGYIYNGLINDAAPGLLQDQAGNTDDIMKGRNILRTINPTGEFFDIPYGALKYVNDPPPPNTTPPELQRVEKHGAILVSAAEISYTWYNVPFLPNALYSFLGCVNDASFDKKDKGTLLLIAVDKKPYRQITGELTFDITYKMKHFNPTRTAGKPVISGVNWPLSAGHNHLLRINGNENPKWTLATYTGQVDGDAKYPFKDFSQLFQPSADYSGAI